MLALQVTGDKRLQIGRLGTFTFRQGFYLYTGSAMGAGGVAARLRHHSRMSANPRWHLDYLRRQARPATAWVCFDETRRECEWAEKLRELSVSHDGPKGFGASDCRCPSHLLHIETPDLKTVLAIVKTRLSPDRVLTEDDLRGL